MRSTELRIGNYIYSNGQITSIGFKIISDMYVREKLYDLKEDPLYKPITLSENLILTLGFSYNDFHLGYDGFGFTLHVKENGNTLVMYNGQEITVVTWLHELQNLIFSITREELKIDKSENRS